jgi:hypothetical protein
MAAKMERPIMIAAKKATLQDRDVFAIAPYQGGWAVEHNGEYLDASTSQDEVRASAHRRARACHDTGRLCQVVVSGESGFFAATGR